MVGSNEELVIKALSNHIVSYRVDFIWEQIS